MRELVEITPAEAGVGVDAIFYGYDHVSSNHGPMHTGHLSFWRVVAVTPKRVRVIRLDNFPIEYIPDPDGHYYGGQMVLAAEPLQEGRPHLCRLLSDGERVVLHVPGRAGSWTGWGMNAVRWDGTPLFLHYN